MLKITTHKVMNDFFHMEHFYSRLEEAKIQIDLLTDWLQLPFQQSIAKKYEI